MRFIHLPAQSNKVVLKNKYNFTLSTFTVSQNPLKLPITKKGEYYITDNNIIFYNYDGSGILEYNDALVNYDLSDVDYISLDYYCANLQHKEYINDYQRSKILLFFDVMDLNITKGFLYCNPLGYERLKEKLLNPLYNL